MTYSYSGSNQALAHIVWINHRAPSPGDAEWVSLAQRNPARRGKRSGLTDVPTARQQRQTYRGETVQHLQSRFVLVIGVLKGLTTCSIRCRTRERVPWLCLTRHEKDTFTWYHTGNKNTTHNKNKDNNNNNNNNNKDDDNNTTIKLCATCS